MASRMESSLVTSVLTNNARLPSSSASALPLSAARSAMTTPRPSACSRRTAASPRPPAPPLTIADASLNFSTLTYSPLAQLFRSQDVAHHEVPRLGGSKSHAAQFARVTDRGAV